MSAWVESRRSGTARMALRSACMAHDQARGVLTHIGTLTSRPGAFVVFGVYAVAWVVLSPETLDWHSVATLATWVMTLFIQRAEHRDTQAIQAKLDELLRADPGARNEVIRTDDSEPEDIERVRGEGREEHHL
jgi:low affinity Fe/Cu permease